MTVQNMTVKNVYEGNGSATVFPYTFVLSPEDGEHVGVYVTDENEFSRRVTNFTVDTKAKTVKYPIGGVPLPAGKRLTLRREIPAQQELNLENQGAFFAEDIEGELDRIVMMIQQLAETLRRAIVVDMASTQKPQDLLLEILNNLRAAVTAMHEAVAAKTAAESAAQRSQNSAGQSLESANRSATSANEAQEAENASKNNADLAQAWAEAPHSPNGAEGRKSAKMWAKEAQENGAAEVKKAKHRADEAKTSEKIAQTSAAEARGTATEVSRILTDVNHAALYDPNRTYAPGECAMVENGDVYRCTRESRGENPVTSPKWVSVATTIFHTFELDKKGDLMPRKFPQSSTLWSVDDNGDIMAADI